MPFKNKEKSKQWFRDYRRRVRAEQRMRAMVAEGNSPPPAEVQPQPDTPPPQEVPQTVGGLPVTPATEALREMVRAEVAKAAEQPTPPPQPQQPSVPSRPLRTTFLVR